MVESTSALSSAVQTSIRNTQRVSELSALSSTRLSTGLRVNGPADEPSDYFQARALSQRVGDLAEVKNALQLEQNAQQLAQVGLESVERFSQQLESLAYGALYADSVEERRAYAEQFNEIRTQLDSLVDDTSFRGRQLIETSSVAGLGIGDATSDYNDFATAADVDAALLSTSNAVTQIRNSQADLATDLSISRVREDFTDGLGHILREGADQLVSADLNQEAAIQLAAQVRSDLSFQGQKILAQGDSLLFGLFQ